MNRALNPDMIMNPTSNAQLTRLLDFAFDDLAANRAGVLSERQQRILQQHRREMRVVTLLLFSVPGLLLGGLLIYLLTTVGALAQPDEDPLLILGVSGLLVAALLLVALPTLRQLFSNGSARRVLKASGQAQIVMLPVATPFFRPIFGSLRAGSAVYRLRIGSISFRVAADLGAAFEEGGHYTVYYIHNTAGNRMVSIELNEPIENAASDAALD